MGYLLDGVWREDVLTNDEHGRFVRQASKFHNWITPDGSPGPTGEGGFKAEAGRYHLYISLACPWAHRTLIFRALKQLESAISLSVVDPIMGPEGWVFSDAPGAIPDSVEGKSRLSEIYLLANPQLHRPRHGSDPLGQAEEDDREQRVFRNHPHVQFGLQRAHAGS